VLGQYWQDLTPDQQAHFIETFTRLSIANYASRFDGYNAEHFTYLSDKEQKKGRILVMTMFQTQKRDISFNYLLQLTDDSWRIINVVVDGVSDLSLKRSDYGAILKNEGFNGLVKKLQEKIELSEHSADETQDSSVES
jgi:phospholipid transport system substrate-binding protein